MKINVGASTLGQLFASDTEISVPSFQRNFSWKKPQVSQFLSDVFDAADTGEGHFWGPIVVLRMPNSPNVLEVIDGQQRITSSIVLMSILRDRTFELTQSWVNAGLPGQYDLKPVVRNILFTPPLFSKQRFSASYMIRSFMRDRVIADPLVAQADGSPPKSRPPVSSKGLQGAVRSHTRELRDAYQQIEQAVGARLDQLSDEPSKTDFINRVYHALTTYFEIHTMELSDEDDAYLLFESLNDRGLRLNPSDLLKTFTLREIKDGDSSTLITAIQIWDDAVDALGDYDFTKFLRHYLLTRSLRKINAGNIFSEFKNQIAKFGQGGALKNLQEIGQAADLYANLLGVSPHQDTELEASFARMNTYSDTHRVFLLGALLSNLSIQDLRHLSRAIEYLSFRWISLGKNAQELETLYQTTLHTLLANLSTTGVSQAVATLLKAAPSDLEMTALLQSGSSELQRYLLRRIEESTGAAVPDKTDLEHLAPQDPGSFGSHWYGAVADPIQPDSAGLVYEDYVNSWGNLTLLESRLNRSIRNQIWSVKVAGAGRYKGISASNFNLNQKIKAKAGWTSSDIKRREAWIVQCALLLVGATWVQTGKAPVPMWPG